MLLLKCGSVVVNLMDRKYYTTISVYDENFNEISRPFKAHEQDVLCLAEIDNFIIASGSRDGTVKIWNLTNGELIFTFLEQRAEVKSIYKIETGLLASYSAGMVIIWNPYTGKVKNIIKISLDFTSFAVTDFGLFLYGSESLMFYSKQDTNQFQNYTVEISGGFDFYIFQILVYGEKLIIRSSLNCVIVADYDFYYDRKFNQSKLLTFD